MLVVHRGCGIDVESVEKVVMTNVREDRPRSEDESRERFGKVAFSGIHFQSADYYLSFSTVGS